MTDAEMEKAMEICKDKEIPCDDCPLVECGDCEGISRQYFYDRFNELKSENAELKSSLTHANEECLKWHERAQNLLKDSGGSISGYEKKISDLQSENAALRERLERAVVNGKRFIVEKQIDGREVYVVCRYKVIKSYICTEYTREAAVARLAELKGEK